jgi:hypothetical protein
MGSELKEQGGSQEFWHNVERWVTLISATIGSKMTEEEQGG